ncbi:MAG: FixH family protein [Leptospiraceae bacterium]|nr:FixH family protein [Leptospiraceae bacterium]
MQDNKISKLETGQFFLKILLVIFFSLLFIGTYITLKIAYKDYEGVMEKNYYEKGLNFEKEIEVQKKLLALGYRIEVENLESIKVGQKEIKLIVSKNNTTLTDVKSVKLLLEKPSTSKFNKDYTFKSTEKGVFTEKVEITSKGKWILSFYVELSEGILEQRKLIEVL